MLVLLLLSLQPPDMLPVMPLSLHVTLMRVT